MLRKLGQLLIVVPLLCGFASFGNKSGIAVLVPGSNVPQQIDGPGSTNGVGNPSISRWADNITAVTRQTPTGSGSDAGHTQNVIMNWDNPFQDAEIGASGNYTLNGVPGVLVCVHANHISNTPLRWSGTPGSMTSSPNTLISVQFAVDGGAWVTASAPMIDPFSGTVGDYCAFTPMSALTDRKHEWRAYGCAATGYCAYLSSEKNVTENYPPVPSGTLTSTVGSSISAGTLVSGTETITYTQNQAEPVNTVTSASASGTTETLNFTTTGSQPLGDYYYAGQTIVVHGITGSGNWNTWAGLITGGSGYPGGGGSAPASISFYNPNVSGTAPTSVVGASFGDYSAGFVPGQTIVVSGVTPSSYNTTGAVVTTNYCTASGIQGTVNNCVVSFINGSGSATYTSGGTITTNEAVFLDPGQHRAITSSANPMVAITGSSDVNVPNFVYSGTAGSNSGIYCISGYQMGHPQTSYASGQNALNPGTFELLRAYFDPNNWYWRCISPTSNVSAITLSTNGLGVPLETVTYTDATNWYIPPGDTVTVGSVAPTTLNLTKALVYSSSCSSGTCTVALINNGATPASGTYSSGGTVFDATPSTNVLSDGTGQNMTVIGFGDGGGQTYNSSRMATVTQGSLFLTTNAGGSIPSTTTYVDSVVGLNNTVVSPMPASNCQNSASPCQTLDIAMASMASTSTLNAAVQSFSNPGSGFGVGCLVLTNAGNNAGGVPLAVNQSINFRGHNGSMSGFGVTTMIAGQSYFVKAVSSTAFTVSEYPGGPCINDTASAYGVSNVAPDFSFDNVFLECTVPTNCPNGSPQQFFFSSSGPFVSFNAPYNNMGYTNVFIGAGTQIAAGPTGTNITRLHVVGGKNTVTPDVAPNYTSITTTADIPPLANVGPSPQNPFMPGYPVPTPVTSATAVTSGSGKAITLSYTDAANKTFQVNSGIAAQVISVSGSARGDWNCTGAVPTTSAPTTCYITASSCASGACTATYYNASATTLGTFSDPNLKVLVQDIALPVNFTATAGCTSQPCVPLAGATIQTSTTVGIGVTPVGPGGGFIWWPTGGTANTDMSASTQNCLNFAGGQNDPGMGSNDGGPPGDSTWVAALSPASGTIQDVMVTTYQAQNLGMLNWVDCPAGTVFNFFDVANFGPFGTPFNLWLDSVNLYSPSNITPAIANTFPAFWYSFVNNTKFDGLQLQGMTIMQNGVMANSGACFSQYYIMENVICYGLSSGGPDAVAVSVAAPSVLPIQVVLGQPSVPNQGCAPTCYSMLAGTGPNQLTPLGIIPPHITIGWLDVLTCKDAGNSWTVNAWVTGYNFKTGVVSFANSYLANSPYSGTLTIPSNCVQVWNNWQNGIHFDFNFTNVSSNSPFYQIGTSAPTQELINIQTLYSYGLWTFQGGAQNSYFDDLYERNGQNMDDQPSSGGGAEARFHQLTNYVMINNAFPLSGIAYLNNVFNGLYVVNPTPQYQISSYSVSGSTETVNYADVTNKVWPVGTNISVIGTSTGSSPYDMSNNSLWSGQVLASPPAGCTSGTCHLSFTNPLDPTGTSYGVTGVLQIVNNVNPATYGAYGCVASGTVTTSIPPNVYVWPAYNSGNWSATGGINDIRPWYPMQSTSTAGTGSC